MADNLFVREADALLLALKGGQPSTADYSGNISTERGETGSANHKMLCNAAGALDARTAGSLVAQILDWCEWYVDQPLHENEGFTGSGAYRPAIMFGTYALAGAAKNYGRLALCESLLRRTRADVHWLILGAATGPARAVRDHQLGKVGRAVLLVGDGKRQGLPRSNAPYVAIAGKRCHVREGKGHSGNFEYTDGIVQSLIVAQALGLDYSPGVSWHAHFAAIVNRWPTLPAWGLTSTDRTAALAFLQTPAEPVLARSIFAAAKGFRPKHPGSFIRWEDATIAAVAWKLDRSSTGGRAVDMVRPNGMHYIGSADTGGRDEGGPVDVRAQTTTESAEAFVSRWDDGAGEPISTPKPVAIAEAWRVDHDRDNARFVVPGVGELPDGGNLPNQPPAPVPAPGPIAPTPGKPDRPSWIEQMSL